MRISDYLQREIVAPKRELDAQLAEVESAADLVSKAVSLRPRLNGMLNWELLAGDERRLATEFMELRDANSRAVLNSLFVICYGSLEKFVRELVERSIAAVNSGCRRIEEMPEFLINENIFRTGQVLQTVKVQKTSRSYDFIALADALSSCKVGSTEISLNAECFPFQHGIVTPGNIDKLLARLGVTLNWDRFGSDAEIRDALGEQKTRECSKAVNRAVTELVDARNIVSHTGGLELEKNVEDVRKYTKLLPPFCAVLTQEVGKQMDKKFGAESE